LRVEFRFLKVHAPLGTPFAPTAFDSAKTSRLPQVVCETSVRVPSVSWANSQMVPPVAGLVFGL
jgi:hypothetical protein